MSYPFSLPENYKLIAATPQGAENNNGGVTFDSISLKYAHKVWIVLLSQQVVGHASIVNPLVGLTVAAANVAITFTARWWLNVNIAATDTLVEQAAATTMAFDVAQTDQMMVIEIDPSDVLAQLGTYDCLGGTITATGQDNYTSALYVAAIRYEQATPPSMIVN